MIINAVNDFQVKVRAGQTFDFDIGVTGEPPPKKVWTLRGAPISGADLRVKLVMEDYNIKLKVNSSTFIHSSYTSMKSLCIRKRIQFGNCSNNY